MYIPFHRFPHAPGVLALILAAALVLSPAGIGSLSRLFTVGRGQLYAMSRYIGRFQVVWQTRFNWNCQTAPTAAVCYPPELTSATPELMLQEVKWATRHVAAELGIPAPSLPRVVVLIHPDRASLRQVFGWSAAKSASGVYWSGVIRVLSPQLWIGPAEGDDLAETLRSDGPMVHEVTHLVLDYATNGNYEAWFSEGLAQWEERKLIGWEWRAGEQALQRQPLPFSVLRTSFHQLEDEALAYRQSLRMVEFIVDEVGESGLKRMIELLAAGHSTGTAIERVVGLTPPQFHQHFVSWLRKQ